MSAEARAWVKRYSPYRGATFQIHQAIAEVVNDLHHHEFWMSVTTLAEQERMSRRMAGLAVGTLLHDGFIELVAEATFGGVVPAKAARYRFRFPEVAVVYESESGAYSVRTAGNVVPTDPANGANEVRTGGAHVVPERCEPGSHNPKEDPKEEDPKETGSRKRRWRVVPPAEELTDDRRRMAREEGIGRDEAVEFEWRKFTRHEFASPRSDVDRTWQNWCAKEAAWHGVTDRRDRVREADRQQEVRARTAERRSPSDGPVRVIPDAAATMRMLKERGL